MGGLRAGQSGAAGVRRVLAREREEVPAPAARSLGAALEEPQRLLRLEVFEARGGGRAGSGGRGLEPARWCPRGGCAWCRGPEGYWAFSNGPGDGGVDVRPVSAAEAGGLLTVLAGAVFRPLPDPATGPARGRGRASSRGRRGVHDRLDRGGAGGAAPGRRGPGQRDADGGRAGGAPGAVPGAGGGGRPLLVRRTGERLDPGTPLAEADLLEGDVVSLEAVAQERRGSRGPGGAQRR